MIHSLRALSGLFAALLIVHLSSCSCSSGSGPVPPSGLSYSSNPSIYALGFAIEPNVPTVGGHITTWEVSPDLPAGLVLDSSTGLITGIPTELAEPAGYTVEAINSSGHAATELILAVLEISPPSNLSYSPANPYEQGLAVTPLVPTVDGIVFEYALGAQSPPLPPGLVLGETTGAISGTPLRRTTETVSVTVVATNPAGQTSAVVPLQVAARAVRFAYVANRSDNTLGAYALDSATGQLTGRGYAKTGELPRAVAVSPLGTGVYVANYNDGTLSVFFADITSGALSLIQTVAAGVGPRDVEVTPAGRLVFALNGLSGDISRYRLDENTGELVPLLPRIGLGAPAQQMVLHPTGQYLYVVLNPAATISVFRVDEEIGGLALIQHVPLLEPVADIIIDPSGRFLYVPSGPFNVWGHAINAENGTLSSISGSPWSVGSGAPVPVSAVVSADGRHLYTANHEAHNVSQFAIDDTTGRLNPRSPLTVPAGVYPEALAMAGQDEFLFVTNTGSSDVRAYDVDGNGLLSPIVVAPSVVTGVTPFAIATLRASAPLGTRSDFIYAANRGSNNISGYSADAGPSGSGDLTGIAGSPFDSGGNPLALSVHRSNRFLYSADSAPGSVSLFTIDASTGVLTAGTGIGFGSHSDLLLEPSGLYAYGVLPGTPSQIAPYTIDASTGVLTAIGTTWNAGDTARRGAVHPTGRFLFVASTGSGEVSTAAIAASTGLLSTVTAASTAGSPQAVAVHPSGRWMYAPNKVANVVSQFSINALSGTPLPLTPASVSFPTSGGDATDVAIHPGGRFLYVSNGINNEVLLFTIDPATGLATGVSGSGLTAPARGVLVDASGRFLYVSTDADEVVTFLIDAGDGSLTITTTAGTGTDPQGLAGTRNDF